jgi:hypothetical protein
MIFKFFENFQILEMLRSSIMVENTIQLLHLNEINMRFYGAEYNNIERGKSEFNIVVLCSIPLMFKTDILQRHVTVHYFPRIVQPEAVFFPYWTSR